jgi:hypothetical protein
MIDEPFDIDMNVLDIASNVIESISFQLFHGHGNSTICAFAISSFIDSPEKVTHG